MEIHPPTHIYTNIHIHLVKFLITTLKKVIRFHLTHTGGTVVKNLPANAGDTRDVGLTPGSGRSPGGGTGNPLQYSCLKDSMRGGAWQATVHGVAKSQTCTDARLCL